VNVSLDCTNKGQAPLYTHRPYFALSIDRKSSLHLVFCSAHPLPPALNLADRHGNRNSPGAAGYAKSSCPAIFNQLTCRSDLAQPSCLLAIPRELRDQIYGYLHRPNKFSCRTRSTGGDISIHVEQSPIIEVLLTCSRLHHEYLDSSVYTQLTAIMDTSVATKWHVIRPALHTNSLVTAGLLDRTSDASPMSDAALNQVLACLKHIVWILNDRTGKPPWGVALSQVRGITNTLEELCHSLVSFKVGIKTEVERDIVECKRSERLAGNHPIINHSLAFLQVPKSIFGLPI
jgi:hypothetical protein